MTLFCWVWTDFVSGLQSIPLDTTMTSTESYKTFLTCVGTPEYHYSFKRTKLFKIFNITKMVKSPNFSDNHGHKHWQKQNGCHSTQVPPPTPISMLKSMRYELILWNNTEIGGAREGKIENNCLVKCSFNSLCPWLSLFFKKLSRGSL